MKQVNFNGEKLSKLSFGTVQLGLDYGVSNKSGKPSQKTANDIVAYLLDQGINCFDTAVAYGNSEEVLGHALNRSKNVHIVSKIKTEIFTTSIVETVYRSLKRLNIDRLLGLLLHDSDLLPVWKSDYTDIVEHLKTKGLIRHFGVSIYDSEEFKAAIDNPAITIIQLPFNLFDQRAVEEGWFKKAKNANKLVFIRSTFLQGLFFMDPNSLPKNLAGAAPFLKRMHEIRKDLKLTIPEFAMSYAGSISSDAIILFGCETLEQAKENINCFNNLPTLDKSVLTEINASFKNVPKSIFDPSQWRL